MARAVARAINHFERPRLETVIESLDRATPTRALHVARASIDLQAERIAIGAQEAALRGHFTRQRGRRGSSTEYSGHLAGQLQTDLREAAVRIGKRDESSVDEPSFESDVRVGKDDAIHIEEKRIVAESQQPQNVVVTLQPEQLRALHLFRGRGRSDFPF